MIVAQKVQQAVEGQDSKFDRERMAVLPGLASRHPAGDGQIAEPRGARRAQGASLNSSQRTEAARLVPAFAVCWK